MPNKNRDVAQVKETTDKQRLTRPVTFHKKKHVDSICLRWFARSHQPSTKLPSPFLTLQSPTTAAANPKHIRTLPWGYNDRKVLGHQELTGKAKGNCYVMSLTWNQANLTDIKVYRKVPSRTEGEPAM